jgi:hypothetical protein
MLCISNGHTATKVSCSKDQLGYRQTSLDESRECPYLPIQDLLREVHY